MQNYTRIQLKNHPATLATRRSLSEWETRLGEPFFYRLNRSLIIQVAAMRLSVWNVRSHSLLNFEGVAEQLPIGRHAAARLKEILVQREPKQAPTPTAAGVNYASQASRRSVLSHAVSREYHSTSSNSHS
jgi:hypothetical protein